MQIRIPVILLASVVLVASAPAVDAAPASSDTTNVDFVRDVQPILQQHCSECHGVEENEGGLRLTSRDDLLQRNDSGEPAIVAGESAASELIRPSTLVDVFIFQFSIYILHFSICTNLPSPD